MKNLKEVMSLIFCVAVVVLILSVIIGGGLFLIGFTLPGVISVAKVAISIAGISLFVVIGSLGMVLLIKIKERLS